MDTHNIQCRICLEKSYSISLLIYHMNSHFNNFVCEKCGKGYAMWQSYKNHMQTHEIGSFKCQHCEMTFETSVKRGNHQVRHRKRHYCRLCGKSFPTGHYLLKHRRDDHSIGCPCPDCGKIIMNPSKLQRHIITNHKQRMRLHSCEYCQMQFYDEKGLKLHIVKHSDKRNFKCSMCEKSFTWKNNLTIHLKMHNNIRNHVCTFCGDSFVQHSSLKWHLRKHNTENSQSENEITP